MPELDIVGLGFASLDVLVRLGDMPTWGHAGGFSDFAIDGGGPVGTACAAAARLGARVGYVGTAGADDAADMKVESLRENGVDVSRLVRREGPEGQVILVYVHEETGERVFSGRRGVRDQTLQPEQLDREYITSADYLHLDGCHSDAALQAAQWMREAGRKVSIDCGKTDGRPLRPHLAELVALVDVLICGAGFCRSLTGREDIWEGAEEALARGPRIVVQTEGEDGCYTVTADGRFHTPAFEVDVVDTTGAGDVFHGAYLVGLLRDWQPGTIAQFASAASAINCTRLGGRRGSPTFDEVTAFLAERDIHLPPGA